MKGREMLRDIYAVGSGKTLEASRTSSFNFSFEQKAGFPVPNFVSPGAQRRKDFNPLRRRVFHSLSHRARA
jgi:hypothetical protein